MPTLIFWSTAVLAMTLTLAAMLPPLLGRRRAGEPADTEHGVDIFRDRLAVLEGERVVGALTQDAYREARRELERAFLADSDTLTQTRSLQPAPSPLMALVVAIAVPVLATGLYLHIGTPGALGSASAPAAEHAAVTASADDQPSHSMEEMVARLAQRLAENPNDANGWVMLGRSYAAFNRLPESVAAFENAQRLRPDHPLTLVAHAESLAGLQNNRLEGEPLRMIQRALELDPDFPRALWLAGVASLSRGDSVAAAANWQRLLDLGTLNEAQIRQLQQAMAAAGAAPAQAADRPRVAAGPTLQVAVTLSPELAARVAPDDTVFVFVRAEQGPPMPLAVSRHTASELPITVTLDDSMAMAPQMRLSMFPRVIVAARVSRNGSATPASGDLQGRTAALAPAGATGVSVLIDTVVP